MDKANQTNSGKKEYIDNKTLYAPIPKDVPEKEQTSCSTEWTGNPGSRNVQSVHAHSGKRVESLP